MSAERFFDDLARTLAEPMPRRRAVRVIGASLAAIAVPGISPHVARATPTSRSQKPPPPCPRGELCCDRTPYDPKGQIEREFCGFPVQRFDCSNFKCIDTCPPTNRVLKNPDGTPKRQQATWSDDEYPDGRPKRYNCCPVPDTLPRDGECWPNCKKVLGPKAIQCGKYCCPPGHRCKGQGQCIPCRRGQEGCGRTCCSKGKKCTECRDEGAYDIRWSGTGREKCCASDEKCCGDRCCKKTQQCCGSMCCDSPKEFCASLKGRETCCPDRRMVFIRPNFGVGVALCCPKGTVPVKGKGCCPPGQPDCCPPQDNLGGVLDCSGRGQVCVSGNCVNA